MPTRAKPREVGAMDPDLQNSPIADELDEESDTLRQQVPGEPVCYFNGRAFAHGEYVSSGPQALKCHYGIWVDAGSADPGNP